MSLPSNYPTVLNELKQKIQRAQIQAALAVNEQLLLLYWDLGRAILDQQAQSGWGSKVIQQLAKDLKKAFPEQKGFSERNLKYMRRFAEEYPERQFVQEVLAQIPWYHNITLMEKVKDLETRKWYIAQTTTHGWSRNVMVHQIETQAHQRAGQAQTNFDRTLPAPQSDLAQQVLKDPYSFDFLTLAADAREKELERGLIEHIKDFLLELGAGFAYVGSQVKLEVGDRDFYPDLLFYHLKLRCYVVIELKMTEFEPEYVGKMNFYLSAIDDKLSHSDDEPSIGLILCKGKNRTIVEYTLRDTRKPIGVSEYRLTEALPKELQSALPSIESLEQELERLETAEDLEDEA